MFNTKIEPAVLKAIVTGSSEIRGNLDKLHSQIEPYESLVIPVQYGKTIELRAKYQYYDLEHKLTSDMLISISKGELNCDSKYQSLVYTILSRKGFDYKSTVMNINGVVLSKIEFERKLDTITKVQEDIRYRRMLLRRKVTKMFCKILRESAYSGSFDAPEHAPTDSEFLYELLRTLGARHGVIINRGFDGFNIDYNGNQYK